jgi:hypothetical protein
MFTRQMFVQWAMGLIMVLAVLASSSPAYAYIPEGPDSGTGSAFAQQVEDERTEAFALGGHMAAWKLELLEDISIP